MSCVPNRCVKVRTIRRVQNRAPRLGVLLAGTGLRGGGHEVTRTIGPDRGGGNGEPLRGFTVRLACVRAAGSSSGSGGSLQILVTNLQTENAGLRSRVQLD